MDSAKEERDGEGKGGERKGRREERKERRRERLMLWRKEEGGCGEGEEG